MPPTTRHQGQRAAGIHPMALGFSPINSIRNNITLELHRPRVRQSEKLNALSPNHHYPRDQAASTAFPQFGG
jgi:hypothetical protein